MMELGINEFDDDLEFSYVEQCHNQILKLKQKILLDEPDLKVEKYTTCHRLFKYNIFEYIEPKKRQYLDRVLLRILSSLGNHIHKNLLKIAQENLTTTMRSPTPLSYSSKTSTSSSNSKSTSYSGPRTRSMSGDSRASVKCFGVPELIVISSDEDEDEFVPKKIKTCDINESTSEMIIVKQEKSFDSKSSEERSVNLQDITNGLNAGTSRNDDYQTHQTEECSNPNSQSSTKWASNSLLLVNTREPANFFYDKYGVINLKPKNEIKFTAAGRTRQALILHLIATLYKLVEDGTYITKRRLYYLSQDYCLNKKSSTQSSTQSSSTGTQSQGNSTQNSKPLTKKINTNGLFQALDDLCCLAGCSKVHLHVLSQSKGLIYGNLKFKLDNGECYDCLESKEGTHLPTSQVPIIEISSDAKFVLILEKDSVMQKMLNNEEITKFVETYKVILFTAKGYPDINSRAFMKFLWNKLKMPILVLTDADPHGIEIACSYKFGVYSTAYESAYTAVPQIKWLGFLPSEIKKLSVPETIPQNPIDIKKLESLINRPYLKNKEDWMSEIMLLKELGRKAELEALDKDGRYLIETYLPNKLRFGSWL